MQWFGRKKKYKTIRQENVKFMYEQDGVNETFFKSDLIRLFQTLPDVDRAYVVRADYGNPDEYNVVLAIALDGDDVESLVNRAAGIFAEHFSRDLFIDVLVLSGDQESEVKAVARPFYDRSETASA